MSQTHKYKYTKIHKYTNTQINKYTNTAHHEVPERSNMCYIFEKRIVQGYQKLYPHVPNTQIQKYKYIIHNYTICQSARKWYIFEKRISKSHSQTIQNWTSEFRTVVQSLVSVAHILICHTIRKTLVSRIDVFFLGKIRKEGRGKIEILFGDQLDRSLHKWEG